MTTDVTTIELDGAIGWEILAATVREQLASASPRVQLRISSPGGEVHEGLAIANALRAYRRNGGQVEASIVGVAASMATYLAMFADRVTVEDNAVWMVHNPSTIAWGDYRTLGKAATVLESLRGVMSRAYVEKTKRPTAAIHAEMDDETWLFGEQIVAAGYADALAPAGDGAESATEALALAHAAFSAMRTKLRERADQTDGLDRIAALLSGPRHATPTHSAEDDSMSEPTPATTDEPPVATPTTDDPTPPPPATPEAPDPAAAETARATAIIRACVTARCPELAVSLVAEGVSLDAARARILDHWAAHGGPELRQHGQADAPAASAAWATVISQINARRAAA